MRELLVGVTGNPGVGKTTVSSRLEKEHGFTVIEGSAYLRQQASQVGVNLEAREDYDSFYRLLQIYEGLNCVIDHTLSHDAKRLAHSGLRTKTGLEAIKSAGGLIIAVTCPTETVLERVEPGPKNATAPKEYEEILRLDNSQDAFGSHTQWCIDHADYYIDNSGSITATHQQVDETIQAHTR
jgi:dephospho-CoA kinase